ncbi:MAG: hypothetical protein ACE5II_03860 [Anaerolineae bacterium]
MSVLVPLASTVIMSLFTILVFWQYLRRRKVYQLVWGIGLAMFSLAVLCEFLAGIRGWSPFIYRAWYLFGAILNVAYLGLGTIYLLARRSIAHTLMALVVIASLLLAIVVFTVNINPAALRQIDVTGRVSVKIMPLWVRILGPAVLNTFGTLALVGGAFYSAWVFWRKRVMPHRVLSNVLIALGALVVAASGTLATLGSTNYLFVGELVGGTLIFIGFLKSTGPEGAV